MLEELINVLEQRARVGQQIRKLQQLLKEGEVSEDIYSHLKSDYKQKFQEAENRIRELKAAAQSKLSVSQASLGAYEGQSRKLAEAWEAGELSQKDYEKQREKIHNERARFAESQNVPLLEAIVQAKTAGDLKIWAEAQRIAPSRRQAAVSVKQASPWGNVALRVLTGLVAAVLISSILFPFFPNSVGTYVEEGYSLAKAARALRSMHFAFLLLAVGPLVIGLPALLLTGVSRRGLRGFLLLLLSSIGLGGLTAAIGALLCYPHPLLAEGAAMLAEVSRMGIGVPLLLGSLVGLHVLALLSMWRTRFGLALWILSLVMALSAGGATAAACIFGTHPEVSLTLEELELTPDMASVKISVNNEGNVSVYLVQSRVEHPSRNTYTLSFELQQTDEGWVPLNPFGETFANQPYIPVGVRETYDLSCEVPLAPEQENIMLQAHLHSASGETISSETLILTPPQPEVEEEVVEPEEEQEEQSEKPEEEETVGELEMERRDAALESLHTVTEKLKRTKPEILADNIAETRRLIGLISTETERQRLHELLDKALLVATEREAASLLEQASQAFQSESYERTISLCREIREVYDDLSLRISEEVTSRSSTLLSNAEGLMSRAQLASEPSKRYKVTGIAQLGPGKTAAVLVDNFLRSRLRVSEGDDVNGWRVTTIEERAVMLEKGGREVRLEMEIR